MMGFTQPSNKSPTEYAEVLLNKVLRCDRVYEYVLKGTSKKDYRNQSATVCLHNGILRRTLQYMI